MKSKLMILIILGLLLVLPLVIADEQDYDYVFKVHQEIDLKRPCWNNGTYCSPAAICNLTTLYPNGTALLSNEKMSNSISYFNMTLKPQATGLFFNLMTCHDGDQYGSETFYFKVNPTGDSRSISLPLILLIASLSFFVIGIVVKNPIVGFIDGVLFLITGIYVMIYGFADLANLYTRTIGIVSIGLGLIISVVSSLEAIEDFGEGKF